MMMAGNESLDHLHALKRVTLPNLERSGARNRPLQDAGAKRTGWLDMSVRENGADPTSYRKC